MVFAARRCLPFRRLPLGGLTLPLGGLAFGFAASAFRHAPLRGCRSAGWPSGSRLPLFGTHRFGVALVGLVLPPSASEIALGGLVFGLTASAFRHALIRSGCWASSFFRLPLRKLPSAGWPSGSRFPLLGMRHFGVILGELAFGLTASAFRHAPLRRLPLGGLGFGLTTSAFGTHRFGVAAGRVGSAAFRFGDCRSASWPSDSRLPLFGMRRFGVALGELVLPPSASEIAARRVGLRAHASGLPSASWPSGSRLPLFGTHRFGDCRSAGCPSGSRLPLFGTHRFGVAARRVGSSAFRFGDCRSAGWPSGSRLPLFGTHRSAPPCRRREGRRSTPTRHLFHFKTLISTC